MQSPGEETVKPCDPSILKSALNYKEKDFDLQSNGSAREYAANDIILPEETAYATEPERQTSESHDDQEAYFMEEDDFSVPFNEVTYTEMDHNVNMQVADNIRATLYKLNEDDDWDRIGCGLCELTRVHDCCSLFFLLIICRRTMTMRRSC